MNPSEGPSTELSTLDYYVLDAMMDLIQSVETIVGSLNHPEFGWAKKQAPFTRELVGEIVIRLVSAGLVERFMRDEMSRGSLIPHQDVVRGTIGGDWFGLTKLGRATCEDWQDRLDGTEARASAPRGRTQ
jgi:hypothetical protein